MTIHIRQFSIDSPATMQAIRTIGETEVIDALGNKLCLSGTPDSYNPCFENKVVQNISAPLRLSQICSWPSFYPQMVKSDGKLDIGGHPPTACGTCQHKNNVNCLGFTKNCDASCIFTVRESRFIRPQFVLLGKNWSANVVDHKVANTCWGNGNNKQAQWLRGTIFEGGYFTDFVKGKTLTNWGETQVINWLQEVDPLLDERKERFKVFLDILAHELELLQSNFNLSGTDKYIVVWGPGILRILNKVSYNICNRRRFEQLDCITGYKVKLFGAHYSINGGVLRSLPKGDRNMQTIRRIYASPERRTEDNINDGKHYDFEIMPEQKVLLPNGTEEKIVWLE